MIIKASLPCPLLGSYSGLWTDTKWKATHVVRKLSLPGQCLVLLCSQYGSDTEESRW